MVRFILTEYMHTHRHVFVCCKEVEKLTASMVAYYFRHETDIEFKHCVMTERDPRGAEEIYLDEDNCRTAVSLFLKRNRLGAA